MIVGKDTLCQSRAGLSRVADKRLTIASPSDELAESEPPDSIAQYFRQGGGRAERSRCGHAVKSETARASDNKDYVVSLKRTSRSAPASLPVAAYRPRAYFHRLRSQLKDRSPFDRQRSDSPTVMRVRSRRTDVH